MHRDRTDHGQDQDLAHLHRPPRQAPRGPRAEGLRVIRPDHVAPRRMLATIGEPAAREALSALAAHVDGFDPATVTGPQRDMIRSECETIRRRLDAVEAEAARERGDTAARAGERESYLRAAEALAGQGAAAEGDRGRLERAAAAAAERLRAERAADAGTEAWLAGVRAAVETLARAGDDGPAAPAGGGTPPVLRSLSRIGAMLGAMLREAETRRGGEE